MTDEEKYEYYPFSDSPRSTPPPAASISSDSVLSDNAGCIVSPQFNPADDGPAITPPPNTGSGDADSMSTIVRNPTYSREVSSDTDGSQRENDELLQPVTCATVGLTPGQLALHDESEPQEEGYNIISSWLESVAIPAFAPGYEDQCLQESQLWTLPPVEPFQCMPAEPDYAWARYARRPRSPTVSTTSEEADTTGDSLVGTSVSRTQSSDNDAEAYQNDREAVGEDPLVERQ